MQLKMEKKSPQQPLSSEELECGPEKPLKRTEDLEQQSGELNDETKPTDKNSDDDELEEGEVDETLEEGEIDEAIEDVKPDERREPVSVDGALVEESADGQSVGCRVPESDQNSGAVARADGLSSKKVRDAVNRRHAAVRALRHDHQGKVNAFSSISRSSNKLIVFTSHRLNSTLLLTQIQRVDCTTSKSVA